MGLPAAEGFVFGIEGKWGSGKTTLINLTIEALKTHPNSAPEIVSFAPWLIGDRDDLLRSLFGELASAAVEIDPVNGSDGDPLSPAPLTKLQQRVQLRNAVGEKLRAFGTFAGAASKVAKLAGTLLIGVPGGELAATVMERTSDAAKGFFSSQTVSGAKAELVGALRMLSRQIIVFVDDLDRLEPRDATEVMRLVRAVGDLPNVVYVLSYDPDVLAQTLSAGVNVGNAQTFLEKIVQVAFRVPLPEAFDLRRWFREEVEKLFAAELGPTTVAEPNEAKQRLAYVVDTEGGRYLQSPRNVVRTLNALRLHAVPVRTRIDIIDMVWLQLLWIGNKELYFWVEEYMVEVAAIANGASFSNHGKQKLIDRLVKIISNLAQDIDLFLVEYADILPGIGTKQGQIQIFVNLTGSSTNAMIAGKRLGSPQHYRLYFAFSHRFQGSTCCRCHGGDQPRSAPARPIDAPSAEAAVCTSDESKGHTRRAALDYFVGNQPAHPARGASPRRPPLVKPKHARLHAVGM